MNHGMNVHSLLSEITPEGDAIQMMVAKAEMIRLVTVYTLLTLLRSVLCCLELRRNCLVHVTMYTARGTGMLKDL